MRDKDQIILENCYSKIVPKERLINEEEETVHRVLMRKEDVNMNVYASDEDMYLDEHSEVYIKFKLDISLEKYGVDIQVKLLEIEPFRIKLIKPSDEGQDEEFFYDIPAVDISDAKLTFGFTDNNEYGNNKTYIQIAPQYIDFEIKGVQGARGLNSMKIVGYKIDPKTVEVDFSR